MEDENPYASPRSNDPLVPPRTGIWRQGKWLVVGREARLPEICPMTNQPAEIRWRAKLRVLSPVRLALGLLLCPPMGLLMYVVFALEGTRLTIPLRRTVLARRQFHRRNAIVLLCAGLLLLMLTVFEAAFATSWVPQPAGGIIGWLLILSAAWYDGLFTPLLSVERLTANHAWIDGACDAYLNRFEQFPE